MDVALVLTHACNLACSYCYTGEKKRVRMPLDVAERALDFAFAQAQASRAAALTIELFGGEPLLEWPALCAIAELGRARAAYAGLPLALQVTTNGTLLDRVRIAELDQLGVHVALSIDATRRAHDRGRPLAGGGASAPAAFRALDELLAAGRPFDVISVVTPENVDDLAVGVRALLDCGVDRLTLNPHWAGAWTAERQHVLEQQYQWVAACLVAWFRRGRPVAVQPFDSALVALAGGERPSCGAGERSFAVAPSGRIYGCARAIGEDTGRGAIGHVDTGLTACAQRSSGCACACAEETGDVTRVGPFQAWHTSLVAALAARVGRALALDPDSSRCYRDTFSPETAS